MNSVKGLSPQLMAGGAMLTIFILGAAFYLMYFRTATVSEVPEIDTGPDVGAQVSGAVETPAEKLPGTNPFAGYTNPFE